MIDKKMFGLILLLLGTVAATCAGAQGQFTLSGEVKLWLNAEVRIHLYTREGWGARGPAGVPVFSQVIQPTLAQQKAGKISFKMVGVPAGSYCLFAFQDTNGNGKWEQWEHQDPWGIYRNAGFSIPSWDEAKFELSKDMQGIVIGLGGQ